MSEIGNLKGPTLPTFQVKSEFEGTDRVKLGADKLKLVTAEKPSLLGRVARWVGNVVSLGIAALVRWRGEKAENAQVMGAFKNALKQEFGEKLVLGLKDLKGPLTTGKIHEVNLKLGIKQAEETLSRDKLVGKLSAKPPQFLKDAIETDGPVRDKGKVPNTITNDIVASYKGITDEFGEVTKDGEATVYTQFVADVTRGNAGHDNYTITDTRTGTKISLGKVPTDSGKDLATGVILTDADGKKEVKVGDPRAEYLKLLGNDPRLAKHLSFYMTQTLMADIMEGAGKLPKMVGGDGNKVAYLSPPLNATTMSHHVTIDGDRVILKTQVSGDLSHVIKSDDNDNFMVPLKEGSNLAIGWTIEFKLDDLREGNGVFNVLYDLHYDVNVNVDWDQTARQNR